MRDVPITKKKNKNNSLQSYGMVILSASPGVCFYFCFHFLECSALICFFSETDSRFAQDAHSCNLSITRCWQKICMTRCAARKVVHPIQFPCMSSSTHHRSSRSPLCFSPESFCGCCSTALLHQQVRNMALTKRLRSSYFLSHEAILDEFVFLTFTQSPCRMKEIPRSLFPLPNRPS